MKDESDEGSPLDSSFIPHPSSLRKVRWVLVNAVPLGLGRNVPLTDLADTPFPGSAGALPSHPERHLTAVVTTFSDMTAYVQAREAIQTSEARYRGLIETLPLLLLQSDERLRITYVNPAYRALTGYSAEEIRDPDVWSRFVHPDDLPRVRELMANTMAGQPGRLEFRYRIRDGSERVFFAISQPQWSQGKDNSSVIGAITLMVDMTRERQLERDLQRSQRLELIGQLASGVAHDFNNLLSVVLSLADLARSHLPPEHPTHGDLYRITEAGEQAVGLASQLLTFCRNRRVVPRRVNLHTAVRRTLELLRSSQPSHLRIEADLTREDLFVQADETQLQQVVMNLCMNARDAMPQGGLLRLKTLTRWETEQPYVLLSVIDNGKGITEEVRGRIFEPFFSTKEGGTGLGLAVVRQIVESAGGRIEVSSQVGKGSQFDVWWPASE
jgi:PAS domain S-box-containing protein